MMATHSQPLFDNHMASRAVPGPDYGYLVTNHLNLMYMLSAGLIMSPSGFGTKYYQDTLGCFPGWIPLFIEKVFEKAVEESVSEANHLRSCLAQIRLNNLTGTVWALRGKDLTEIEFADGFEGTEQVIFVPAPLPTAWIESIVFPSMQDVAACNAEARDYNNVPWTELKRKSGKRLFAKALTESWPPTPSLPERTPQLAHALAAGGSMAMMLHVANRGDLAVQICRLAFDPNAREQATDDASILGGFGTWLNGSTPMELDSPESLSDSAGIQKLQRKLYWVIVDRVAPWRFISNAARPEDIVLECLEEESGQLPERLKQKVTELRNALEDLTGLGALGTTEMFQRFPTPFSRALTLLFLRQTCDQLLEFDHPLLTEDDWLAAALLFGIRSGWQELPLDLRRMQDLAPAVSHRMATIAQQKAQTDLALGPLPVRPTPLREVFMDDWKSRHQEAARLLALKQGWGCLQTTINLSGGHYELRGQGGSVQIVMTGEPRMTYAVNRDRFFQHLANERIPIKAELEARKILKT